MTANSCQELQFLGEPSVNPYIYIYGKNALLMSEVRGEWADRLEMIERQQ